MKQNIKQSPEYWTGHVNRWKESDITQAEYCKKNRIKQTSFSYWVNRLKKSDKNHRELVEAAVYMRMKSLN